MKAGTQDRKVRALAPFLAVLCLTLLTSLGHTQTGGSGPPRHRVVDGNGVDLIQGTFNHAQTLLSIGPSWPQGLHYTKSFTGDGQDNLQGDIKEFAGGRVVVRMGEGSDSFVRAGAVFTPAEPTGSSLVRLADGRYQYGSGQGTVATFAPNRAETSTTPIDARLLEVAEPNGARVSYHYRQDIFCYGPTICEVVRRLQSVTNNFGYQLKLGYAANQPGNDLSAWRRLSAVTAINNAVE